ncbi:VWA domain-containing protein [Marinicella sp. S1101]|uniref:VWA domain-containing protein n=1 Tax=Marinicella marina TaxID=2996016 RepID=UPI002260DA3C|nr:VWA domain-containing protein [Marinicella marina]MCX7554303.1 VWA domain-containing protein [Marinicella marina]MDJ1138706.1 VWA domain-containing protein [Marinicella marina]
MYNFDWPWVFFLLPLPWLVRMLPKVSQASITTIDAPFLNDLFGSKSGEFQPRASVFNVLPWLLLLLAVSKPQWIGEAVPLPVEGRDLMLAIDISGSMEQKDMQINGQAVDRLTAVKKVAGEFIERRVGDRLGLILFGENAYLQVPLTFDRETVKTLLFEAAIGLAGKSTAIGDSIGLAVKKAREAEQGNRVLIVLTDGQNTAGAIEPLKAAELARAEALKIYTIGVGADELVVNSFFGGQRRINPSSDLDEASLKRIAAITEGEYFRARDTNELEQIYAILDELEPLAEEEQFYRPTKELYMWPLFAALLSLFLTLWLRRLS